MIMQPLLITGNNFWRSVKKVVLSMWYLVIKSRSPGVLQGIIVLKSVDLCFLVI